MFGISQIYLFKIIEALAEQLVPAEYSVLPVVFFQVLFWAVLLPFAVEFFPVEFLEALAVQVPRFFQVELFEARAALVLEFFQVLFLPV